MGAYFGPIERLTEKNKNFRQVLFTGKHLQLVLMSLQPREEIGNEVHSDVDQFFRIEEGRAKFVLEGDEGFVAGPGSAIVVPAGTHHNVINSSATKALKLYTIYTPPQHPDGTVHQTKAQAEMAEH